MTVGREGVLGVSQTIPSSSQEGSDPMLGDLLERATGPDRTLDMAVHVAILKRDPEDYKWPAYTASLDAVLALFETQAEGWEWELRCDGPG